MSYEENGRIAMIDPYYFGLENSWAPWPDPWGVGGDELDAMIARENRLKRDGVSEILCEGLIAESRKWFKLDESKFALKSKTNGENMPENQTLTPENEKEVLPKDGQDGKEMSLASKVNEIVSYHAPDQEGIDKITNIRTATAGLLLAILKNCPAGPDRSAAIRKARETMMTANASIVVSPVQF